MKEGLYPSTPCLQTPPRAGGPLHPGSAPWPWLSAQTSSYSGGWWRSSLLLLSRNIDSEEMPPASRRLAVALQVTEKARSTGFKATPRCHSCVYVHSLEVSAEQQQKRSRVGFPDACTSPGARTRARGLSRCCMRNTPGSRAEALHATEPTSSTAHLRIPLNLTGLPSPAKKDESD